MIIALPSRGSPGVVSTSNAYCIDRPWSGRGDAVIGDVQLDQARLGHRASSCRGLEQDEHGASASRVAGSRWRQAGGGRCGPCRVDEAVHAQQTSESRRRRQRHAGAALNLTSDIGAARANDACAGIRVSQATGPTVTELAVARTCEPGKPRSVDTSARAHHRATPTWGVAASMRRSGRDLGRPTGGLWTVAISS